MRNRGKAWKQLRAYVLLRDAGICHLCGHGGSDSADHLIPYVDAPHLQLEPSNVKAAHHTHPCPTCGKRCNMSKNRRRDVTSVLPTLRTSRRWT